MRLLKKQFIKAIRNPLTAIGHLFEPKKRYRNRVISITSKKPLGVPILDRDWDLLVILDTLRVDAISQVADEYSYIDNINRTVSIGGSSPEWMAHTFDTKWRNTLQNTAYLTSNAWIEKVLDDRLQPTGKYRDWRILSTLREFGDWSLVYPDEIGRLERIWEYVPEDERIGKEHDPQELRQGGSPPRYVTDRAIAVGREFEYDRLILHYMQPHAPYTGSLRNGQEPNSFEQNPFDSLKHGVRKEKIWNSYLDELRYVLDDLELLLSNIDAERVIISADHGEAFGEYGIYGHHSGSIHPKIRFVPWIVTSATDIGTYSSKVEPSAQEGPSADDTLEALGYKM
jgi:hypothetical protein